MDRLRRGRQDRLRRPPPSQARTRGAALKFLKEQVGRTCLRGVVFTITEIPVPLIREIVAEILAGGDLPVAAPTPPPAATNDTATPEPAPKPARKSKPKPPPALSDGKPGNPGFGDDLWQKVRGPAAAGQQKTRRIVDAPRIGDE